MDKIKFLEAVNAWSIRRCRIEVTEDMLQGWITEKLMPKAKRVGRRRGLSPEVEWNCRHVRRAIQICRIKQNSDLDRTSIIRICLWLRGVGFPLEKIQEDVLKEFKWSRNSLLKQINSQYDPRGNIPLTASKEKRLAESTGQQDAILSSIEIIPAEIAALVQKSVFGKSSTPINYLPERLIREMGIKTQFIPENNDLFNLLNLFDGVLGDPEEINNSGEEIIKTARPHTLLTARELFRNFPWQSFPDLINALSSKANVADSLKDAYPVIGFNSKYGRWGVMIFVIFLMLCHKMPKGVDDRLSLLRNK